MGNGPHTNHVLCTDLRSFQVTIVQNYINLLEAIYELDINRGICLPTLSIFGGPPRAV